MRIAHDPVLVLNKWNIIPTIIVSPSEYNGRQVLNLFWNFCDKHRLLHQFFFLMIVENLQSFCDEIDSEYEEIQRMTNTFWIWYLVVGSLFDFTNNNLL